LSYGFSGFGNKDSPEMQCGPCNKILSNSCLALAKLKRHLATNHPDHKDKPLDFFKRKLVELEKDQFSMIKVKKQQTKRRLKLRTK